MRLAFHLVALLLPVTTPAMLHAWCVGGAPPVPGPPPARDVDDDDLNEIQETFFGTDPVQADTDQDGTLDSDEDADGDGIANVDEPTIFSFEGFRDPFFRGPCNVDVVVEGANLCNCNGLCRVDATETDTSEEVSRSRSFNNSNRLLLRGLCPRVARRIVGELRVQCGGARTNRLRFPGGMECNGREPKLMAAAVVRLKTGPRAGRRRLDYVALGGCDFVERQGRRELVTRVRLAEHDVMVRAPFGAVQIYPSRVIVPMASRAKADPAYPFTDRIRVGDQIRVVTSRGESNPVVVEDEIANVFIPRRSFQVLMRDRELQDHDGDGLASAKELRLGTDPLVWDTDHDGLNDRVESRREHSDPLDPDTDGDGILDGNE